MEKEHINIPVYYVFFIASSNAAMIGLLQGFPRTSLALSIPKERLHNIQRPWKFTHDSFETVHFLSIELGWDRINSIILIPVFVIEIDYVYPIFHIF
ncbi:hypothetical protein F5B22DRAFT_423782 [Xylaria bambusicola]|uniref:uncharacterized protein n=1 Tax=Xylaria bambusicola TaxID=326684 RepID=UPI002008CA68|nr:uncharacterized protein F5B22DRAFT_423782 [Xylaria bambusicola]KAI0508245.1 hypothetical protein F5B22DRAFT_423782 [Xylaria bambusicola]